MSQNPNPFLRGYWNLKIVRTLCISYDDGSPHVWRNIHASQQFLSDEELVSSSCIVTNDFAVISNGPEPLSDEVLAECDAGEGVSGEGVIGAVVYAIHGEDFDVPPSPRRRCLFVRGSAGSGAAPEFRDRLLQPVLGDQP